MPAKFTSHIREFIASAFLSAIEGTGVTPWVTGTSYAIGQKVSNSGNVYVAAGSGFAGAASPTHTAGSASDGSIDWIYVETAASDKLFEGNMFIGIGKQTDWPDPLVPPNIDVIDSVETAALKNVVTYKSIRSSNMKVCAIKTLWTPGTVYDQYDTNFELTDYINPFFVITSGNRIYKCLDNNSGVVSTSEPTSVLTTPFRTIDGYVWKFMGNVNSNDAAVFMTEDFMPVSVRKAEVEDPEQWAVQQTAQRDSISTWKIARSTGSFTDTPLATVSGVGTGATAGAVKVGPTLTQVYAINPGSNYVESSTYAIVKNGAVSGSGATATATIDAGGVITAISVDTSGSDYTSGAVAVIVGVAQTGETLVHATGLAVTVSGGNVTGVTFASGGSKYASATIYIIPGTAGAVALPVMAPSAGHGLNIVSELAASTVMVSTKLTNTVNDTGYFLIDAGSEFHQIVLVTDVLNHDNSLYATNDLYIGESHPSYAAPGLLKKAKAGSGVVLYINNVKTVTRSADQEEDIKVAITL